MAEVVRPGVAAAPMRHPPSAFAEVQQQPDGADLNLESLLPSDLTFAIEFAQPAKPSKPPAYKPTALPTQLLQPSTSAVIPPNNPWSYDPSETAGRANLGTQNQQQSAPLLVTSRSVPDRSAYSHHHQSSHHQLSDYQHNLHHGTATTAGAVLSPRPPVSLPPPPPPPPPPPRGCATISAATPQSLPVSPSGPVRISTSSSSSASPRQSPVHSRSGNSDYGSGASPEDYYAIGQPPPPPPRDVATTATPAVRTGDGSAGNRGPVANRSFVRRNSAGSGANYNGAPPPPPPPPPPRDGGNTGNLTFCPPLDLGVLTTSACDGSVLVTQNSRGAAGTMVVAPGPESWPPPPPPPPSKNNTPRQPGHLQVPPPPPPPRSDPERLRSRSSSSSAGPYVSGYPPVVPPPPPPPPPPRHPAGAGQATDAMFGIDATIAGDADVASSFKVPTVQEAQMLVAAALQDGTDSSLAAALELSSKLQSLAAQRIAAAALPSNSSRQPSSTPNSTTLASAPGGARSPPALSGANGRGSYSGQCTQPPPPPPPPLAPADSGRLASIGSGANSLYSRTSTTPRSGNCYVPPPPPPPPPPPRHLNSGSSVVTQTSSPPSVSLPPLPPPRAPVPQPPSADVAAVMAALPEVRSPFALYQRAGDDDDCCPTPPDETAILQQQLQQLSHFGTSPPCGFAATNTSTAAATAAAAAAAMTAASSAPFGNPYAGLFGGNAMATTGPFGSPASAFAGGNTIGGGTRSSAAFGSDVFGVSSVASSAVTAAAAACVGSQEVSVASLTSLLTTLAALAKQGGTGSAVPTTVGTTCISPDAVLTGMASNSTSASCSDPSVPGTPAAKATTPIEPSSGSASSEAPVSGSPAGVSIAGSDDLSVAGGATAAVMVTQMAPTPTTSPPASTIAADESALEASELVAPTAVVPAAASAMQSPRDFALPRPISDSVSSMPSLAALQQALALLTVDVPVTPAAALKQPSPVSAAPLNAAVGAMTTSVEASAGLCSTALSLPGLTVTPHELQMARSLHAALKVVALLDSLSSNAPVNCQSTGFRV
ncbi:hypothetical protein Vretimale_13521 [Volvox reticuliferus]|uniref:Uncharacterized protein n=1 Tax=Volvox reticuliferus TaxID=1737510 RepID=A0A8J4BVP6_9CHLO|nr:hypothetical protein Vretifemale_341 [Volvox reticuliferus]GIM09671.1 hypothetical protein Vretimale_13521 [Volvox reticuliferus]